MSNTSLIDQPSAVRTEDALDAAAIDKFIKQYVPGLQGELRINQFKGGASNLTYQLNYDNAGTYCVVRPKAPRRRARTIWHANSISCEASSRFFHGAGHHSFLQR